MTGSVPLKKTRAKGILMARVAAVLTALLLLLAALPAAAGPKANEKARFATFNASLNRFNEGDLAAELSAPGSAQPDVIAEIIQRVRPDVVLINEFDYDAAGLAAAGFQDNYLSVPHGDAKPIVYQHRFVAPSNTGIPSGVDLDNDGTIGGPNDAFGFGFFPGQYGMVVYSKYPIDHAGVRTFQNFLWKDMPDALLPIDPDSGEGWYTDEELEVIRLSSKSHWDIPLRVGARTVHFLVSHPTPPVFDGDEDRNGTRNHDEIRFWADYVTQNRSGYIYDDAGNVGGIVPGDPFVIAGDLNADPYDGDSTGDAVWQLLDHPRINGKYVPTSEGAVDQALAQGGANDLHVGDPAHDTADFSDFAPGNLRADYVLPSKQLKVSDGGVFWPLSDDPLFALVGTFPFPSSDHRLVWLDLGIPGRGTR